MTKIDTLENRVDRLGGSTDWVPAWLAAVGSPEEINEWRTINNYRGPDRYEKRMAFIHGLRAKYGDRMPLSLEEDLERGARELRENKELARSEGLSDED